MIYIAADHAGFQLKKHLIQYLKIKGLDVEDCGVFEMDPEDDYPDFSYPCALRVAQGKPGQDFGIVIGGSGQGEAIVANKVRGIRAAIYNGGKPEIAKTAKEHNNANVLSIGARFVSGDEADMAVRIFLETAFSNSQRHLRRIAKY